MQATAGRIPFRGYQTWYRIVGQGEEPGKFPVVCLHGGPGSAHYYMEPLEALAGTGRRAVFYDQIGCGRSTGPQNPAYYDVALFVDELGVVLDALGLDEIHLFGNSWGGMLAMEYALTHPGGLASLILSSAPASIPQWIEETGRLRRLLPADVQSTLQRHEDAGTTDDAEYEAAAMTFYRRHVCRLDPWPDCVERSLIEEQGLVYQTMAGPNEFVVTGKLRDWDVVDRLGEIDVPSLVVTGQHDEATPAINRTVSRGIPGAESVIFRDASHTAHVERTEAYVELLDRFMSRVEGRRGSRTGVRSPR